MKDFDRFFRKRLEGERPFSKRDENWRQLSRRLDAFDSGIQNKGNPIRHWPKMLWQAAAFTAAAATAWVGWQNHALRTENAELREQISQLAPAFPAVETPVAQIPEPATNPLSQGGDETSNHESSAPLTIQKAPEAAATNSSATPPVKFTAQKAVAYLTPHQHKKNNGQALGPRIDQDKTQPVEGFLDPTVPAKAKDDVVAQEPKENSPSQSDSSNLLAPEKIGLTKDFALLPARDLLRALDLPAPELPADSKNSTATAAASTLRIIRPVSRPARIRVGIQAVAGVAAPKEKGVSLMTGEGLLAEVRVFRGFWAGASVDWMRHEINTDHNPQRFHLAEEPHFDPHGGPPHQDDYKLTKVESEQRQRRFSAGLRYAVPMRGWLRPSVHVAHVWTQIPAAYVSYRFEEEPHGGPIPGHNDPIDITKRSDNQWFKNTWRFGAGLEVNVKSWALGLSADYDKSFETNAPLFDALLIRAGAVYQF